MSLTVVTITLLISKVGVPQLAQLIITKGSQEALPGFEMPSQWQQTHPAFRVTVICMVGGGIFLLNNLR